ncbi:MAG: tyrosine-type recombinase/integrase [Moraxellaceae bacterium]|nr:tyrosine-type recombinase/integrase [Moraxellaceae bacterium]
MKRSEIKKRPLSDTTLFSLEPDDKVYREHDGGGLYFRVKPNGAKSWELRYKKPNGTWSWMGLGSYPEIGGKLARSKARDANKLISDGIDPVAKKAAEANAAALAEASTFRSVAEQWYAKKENDGKAENTLTKIRQYLDKDILPALGNKPIASITRNDCMNLQTSLEKRGAHNVAKKTRGWLNQIFTFAIAQSLIELNPASALLIVAAKAPEPKPQPHLLEPELPEFLRALRRSTSRTTVRTAAWMVLLTGNRQHPTRHAEWSELNLEKGIWTISAEKMKSKRAHTSPLPKQLVEMLLELKPISGRSKWVFPGDGANNPVISDVALNNVFKRMGYKGRMVAHGSRHTASTLLREHGWNKDFVEAQLAHKELGISGVYNMATYLDQRIGMMQWYADCLDALETGKPKPNPADYAA